MWWGGGGSGAPALWAGACGAAAALLLLLLLLLSLRCRRRKRHTPAPSHHALLHQVHIVRDSVGARGARGPRVVVAGGPGAPRCAAASLARSPPERAPPTQQPHSRPPGPSTGQPARSPYSGIPKLPLPDQWLHKRPFDCNYSATIPRPLAQIVSSDLAGDLDRPARPNKFSATRSPSLEKDDKSPFLGSGKCDASNVFGFDGVTASEVAQTDDDREMSETNCIMPPKDIGNRGRDTEMSPSNLRRFRSVSTRLNICSEAPQEGAHERSEMQNSPRILECSSAKEKSSASKFDFSPRILADSLCSPRFFTPPETVSPAFFAEPSPKSVYYDTVLSPKFFPETPRDPEVPQSPRALSDHVNRNNTPTEKCSSPRMLSARPSPKLHSCNKENYFTFEAGAVGSEPAAGKASPRPRLYAGRYSIERERFTPPADKELKKYRRHNSCDTTYKNIELNMSKLKCDEEKEIQVEVIDKDVVDCCAKVDCMQLDAQVEVGKMKELKPSAVSAQTKRDRQRLKSISLDSDNAKIIEQNLGLPIAKQMKDQMNEAYKNQEVSTSCEGMERHLRTPSDDRPIFKFEDTPKDLQLEEEAPKTSEMKLKKSLRQSSDTQSFLDMPRFSPKEFEITVTSEEGTTTSAEAQTKRKGKNLRNLTIDLTKRDSDLEKQLLEFEQLYTNAEEKKVKTPTLKVKATSLDSSESVNLSLPQQKTLDVPQNSISVPNTPKRQLKKILAQKTVKHDYSGAKVGYNCLQSAAEQRRLYMKGQDSGIFLRENHAALMLYQPGSSRMCSRTMGSFDEHTGEFSEAPAINISGADTGYHPDSTQMLGSNLLNYKQNLSISSTNLKTLPEGVPSDDFEPCAEDEKSSKKLHRRNSNQSLMLSTHSLQGSNCSLNSTGASSQNLVRASMSNFSLNDSRQKLLSFERRDSNASISNSEHFTPISRVARSTTGITGEMSKNCLLQRRGSNNSLTLNIQSSNLSRHSSNTSLNREAKPAQKKGLLERRSSNTSLTLSINISNPQLSVVNRGLSVSNYNLNGSTCNLSRYNSNQSIENAPHEPRKGILERRSSNTSLTLNIQPQEPRDLEIDEKILERSLKDLPQRETHRKSLSTENLIPKSYKNRTNLRSSENKTIGFGSHDNLWSNCFAAEQHRPQNLTYVCGDHDNEIIYAFGRQEDASYQQGFVRNITTKPLSPQSTSEDFRLYLANMQHLQNASSVLSRQQLKDLNNVFQNGYSKVKCHSSEGGQHCCTGRVGDCDMSKENPQMALPEPVTTQPCSEYQKKLLRSLHQEFWDMPTNFQEKPIVSGSHPKNRYKTILPNEHSRFLLRGEGNAAEGYVNANFIKGHEYTKNCYIATQGPLQNTIYDFWLMVHQNTINFGNRQPFDPGPSTPTRRNVQKIVMLTNFIENNRQKCEQYFPIALNEEMTFYNPECEEGGSAVDCNSFRNSFVIRNTGMLKKCGYTIRQLIVRYQTKVQVSEVTAYHYWFHNWADHKCPKDVNALLNLSLDVLQESVYDFSEIIYDSQDLCKCDTPKSDTKFVFPPSEDADTRCEVSVSFKDMLDLSNNSFPPTIVHCSAGIGRTGCLVAILNGIKQLLHEQKVDILGIVCNMRLNRGGMVQNSEQYELIHKVLCLFEQECLPKL